jgi:hypothetical protein
MIPKEIKFSEIADIARKFMKPEDIDHYESDLYLRCNDISRQIIANTLAGHAVVERFISNIEPHVPWYAIWWAWKE